jgi:hypothetical protein
MEDLLGVRAAANSRRGSRDPPFVVRFDEGGVEPRVDLVDIEAEQTTPLVERDASLAHEPTHMTHGDPQMLGKVLDGHKVAKISWSGCRRP